MNKYPAGPCVTGTENRVGREDVYMQRSTSNILVLTAGEETVLIDADV